MSLEMIATVGPASLKQEILNQFLERQVCYIRLNLSHTAYRDIESALIQMKDSGIPMILDTEGSQIRTGFWGEHYFSLVSGDKIKIYSNPIHCTQKQIYIRPKEVLDFLESGCLISIDFNSVLLKVISKKKWYVECVALIGGAMGSNKAVIVDRIAELPPFSQKDIEAIPFAKRYGVQHFTLSYINKAEEVGQFKHMVPKAIVFSKIETKRGLLNFEEILKESDGILIDRGDLSREIPFEQIPFAQKMIIRRCNEAKKRVWIATHVLESMSEHLKPMRSEVNDVVNTILDGVNGFVLTKESAVGKYPVATVNMLKILIEHTQQTMISSSFEKLNSLERFFESGTGIRPHGGKLINREKIYLFDEQELSAMKKIDIDEDTLMDVEQIATGAFSPLEGFMNSFEVETVLNKMRLPNEIPWTIPVILFISKKEALTLKPSEIIALVRKQDQEIYATMEVQEIYKIKKTYLCQKWFGTHDLKHPGVNKIFSLGEYQVGGKINLLKRMPSSFKKDILTPAQTRKFFEEKNWSIVVGFHTRNPIHRSHEYIQLKALEKVAADGLFIHPVIGRKKRGDFDSTIVMKSYELMLQHFYPKEKVLLSAFLTYPRYAGPREAILTAICRKNFGCTHFIVGRDHAGVGKFYPPLASQGIFHKFADLGIEPIFFRSIHYSKKLKTYLSEGENIQKRGTLESEISGTCVRKLLKLRRLPPAWLMREKISKMILTYQGKKKPILTANR